MASTISALPRLCPGVIKVMRIRARSLKNGSILYAYEDFELRNEVTVTFLIEGIFQKSFYF